MTEPTIQDRLRSGGCYPENLGWMKEAAAALDALQAERDALRARVAELEGCPAETHSVTSGGQSRLLKWRPERRNKLNRFNTWLESIRPVWVGIVVGTSVFIAVISIALCMLWIVSWLFVHFPVLYASIPIFVLFCWVKALFFQN